MHILYLHQYFCPPDGAGSTRSYEMARRLVSAGHRVTMVTSDAFFPSHYDFPCFVTKMEMDGIRLHVVSVAYANRYSYFRRTLAFLVFALKATLASLGVKNVDIVFATSTPLSIVFPALAAHYWHHCPMMLEVRDLWPELPIALGALRNPLAIWLARQLERKAYWSSARVVALSPGIKEGIVKTGYPAAKVEVIPNCSDLALFQVPSEAGVRFLQKHPHLQPGPLVTYAGTLGQLNGVEYLAEIAAEMLKLNPSVRFLVVGDGRQREFIQSRARALGVLENNFWLLPPLPKSQMPAVLSATTVVASLFINLPEMWNNSANKFFDAFAAGRPVMINYGGWQADILQPNGAGLVVPAAQPAAAARCLHEFLSDPDRLARARQRAEELARSEFNRDLLTERLRSTLAQAAREAGHEAAL